MTPERTAFVRPLGIRLSCALMIIGLLALAAGPVHAEIETESSAVPTSETQARVRVAPLREGTLPLPIKTLGRVGATRQTPASIEARAAGVVSKIVVRDGEAVSSGTVLLLLDPRAAQAELAKARSDLALAEQEQRYGAASELAQQQAELDLAAHQARVKAEQSARDSERLGKLFAKVLVSEKAATEARQAAESARREAEAAGSKAAAYQRSGKGLDLERLRAKVEEARAAVRLAELEAEATTVRSPLAGRVTRVHAAVGQTVDKGAMLIELEASQGVGASFALAPAQAAQVKPRMPFVLRDEPTSRTWRGEIIAVGGGLDPDSGLVRAEGLLDLASADPPTTSSSASNNAAAAPPFLGEVLPGEIVTGESPRGLIAPASALSVTDEGTFLHRVDGERHAHLAPVTVLARTTDAVLVAGEGLKPGQTVIIEGNDNLPDGAGVVVAEERAER